MEYFIKALKQYATFTGRAQRKEYWMFVLFYMIFYVVLAVIDGALGIIVLSTVFSLLLLLPSISVATRRLYDTGRSGWWQLIALIPLIGAIVLIVFLAQDSREDNQYGVNLKIA